MSHGRATGALGRKHGLHRASAEAASFSGNRIFDDVDEADWRWHARMEDALAIFHQWANDERQSGSLGPLALIKVDEKKCFGMIEWCAVREAAAQLLPKHTTSGMETSPDHACGAGRGGTDPL